MGSQHNSKPSKPSVSGTSCDNCRAIGFLSLQPYQGSGAAQHALQLLGCSVIKADQQCVAALCSGAGQEAAPEQAYPSLDSLQDQQQDPLQRQEEALEEDQAGHLSCAQSC